MPGNSPRGGNVCARMDNLNSMTSQSLNYLRLMVCSYGLGYLLIAAASLIRWGAPDPWSRFSLPVRGYFLVRIFASAHSLASGRRVYRDPQTMQEWWATNSDPGGIRRVIILMGLDLSVFLCYGHARPIPLLERPTLQACGLLAYVGAVAAQVWADSHLARFFAAGPQTGTIMNDGLYRYVRHPRYAAALAGKVAFALIFANWLGWIMMLLWAAVLIQKVELEEAHMVKLFGRSYETYQQATRKFLPGVY